MLIIAVARPCGIVSQKYGGLHKLSDLSFAAHPALPPLHVRQFPWDLIQEEEYLPLLKN